MNASVLLLLVTPLLALLACTSRGALPAQPPITLTTTRTGAWIATATRPTVTGTRSHPPTELPTPTFTSTVLPPPPTTAPTPPTATVASPPLLLAPDTVQRLKEIGKLSVAGALPINDFAWTPDGAYLVLAVPSETGEHSPRLTWYEARTISPVVPPDEMQGSRVLFSPDGQFMAVARSGLGEDRLEVRRAGDGRPVQTVAGFFYGIHALAFSPDSRLLAMANGNATVRLVEVKSGLVLHELNVPYEGVHAPLVQDVAFSPDGELVAGAAYGGTVQVWRSADGSSVTTVQTGKVQPNAVVVLDSERFVTTGFPLARVWRIDGTVETELEGQESPLDLALSPDGRLLVTVERFYVLFWDVSRRRLVHRVESEAPLRSVRFSPDGSRLALIGENKIWIWGTAMPNS
ncbi:MAG: hypothetical protein Q9O62_08490 [Ardenticatenia bacterium]|nr:hypothetical protein [Ardenticatenia bacterium]